MQSKAKQRGRVDRHATQPHASAQNTPHPLHTTQTHTYYHLQLPAPRADGRVERRAGRRVVLGQGKLLLHLDLVPGRRRRGGGIGGCCGVCFFWGVLWGVVGGSGGVRWSQPCQASIKESNHAHPARSPIHTHISTNKPTRLPPPPAQVQKLGDGLARRLERLGLGEPVVVVHHQHGRVLLHLLGGVLSLGRPGGVGSWLMGWLGKSSRCL